MEYKFGLHERVMWGSQKAKVIIRERRDSYQFGKWNVTDRYFLMFENSHLAYRWVNESEIRQREDEQLPIRITEREIDEILFQANVKSENYEFAEVLKQQMNEGEGQV